MKVDASIKISSASLILALALVSACSTTAKENKPPLTVMPSTGTVEFNQFVSVFSSTCIANIPNSKGAVTQFEKLGYKPIEPQYPSENDYWQLTDKKGEVYAAIGARVVVFTGGRSGGNGSLKQRVCSVRADLKNAESFSGSPLVLTTPSGDEISLTSVDGQGLSKSGKLLTQSGIANVSFSQSRIAQSTIQGRLPEECNGLSDCITWSGATLELWMSLDE